MTEADIYSKPSMRVSHSQLSCVWPGWVPVAVGDEAGQRPELRGKAGGPNAVDHTKGFEAEEGLLANF